jgi:hypothetical protein
MVDLHFRAEFTQERGSEAGIRRTSAPLLSIRGQMPRAPTIIGANTWILRATWWSPLPGSTGCRTSFVCDHTKLPIPGCPKRLAHRLSLISGLADGRPGQA